MRATSALEVDLPLEQLNPLAQLESWRKEINRPIYHVHKWWANRLGSVFRMLLLAGSSDASTNVWEEFYKPGHDFSPRIVLDPFMGSGTTIGEALKLGYRSVGVDINPVAYFQVRKAFERCDPSLLREALERLRAGVEPEVIRFYKSDYEGTPADILYTFWVKVLPCQECGRKTRLFRRWIFSANAYPGRKPGARAICPGCGEINLVQHSSTEAACRSCCRTFNPQAGPADGQQFTCEQCGTRHRILDVVGRSTLPPEHEMYALLLLLPDGRKVYKRSEAADLALYEEATKALAGADLPIPNSEIPPGFNTDQARGYNYHLWRQMFNDRQLYALGTLLRGILREPDRNARECLLLLFSGILEFNNMFCSFKGEGTGAVRHLFHHHILKPERTPLEANPWGTEKSSGSFSTLFERRLMAAKRYCADPFEVRVVAKDGKLTGQKVYGVSKPLRPRIAGNFSQLVAGEADVLLLSQDASELPIPGGSVDLVVTDPPYFDNVHYSELADFFYCWLRLGLEHIDPAFQAGSSRSVREVQGKDVGEFGELLTGVFRECARVLKPEGILTFTFHHSRSEAWIAVARAIEEASFAVVATHPVRAEMAIGVPKQQAREPINLDLVIVCRQRTTEKPCDDRTNLGEFTAEAAAAVARYNKGGTLLSRGDVWIILMGAFLKARTHREVSGAEALLEEFRTQIEPLYEGQRALLERPEAREAQLSFEFSMGSVAT